MTLNWITWRHIIKSSRKVASHSKISLLRKAQISQTRKNKYWISNIPLIKLPLKMNPWRESMINYQQITAADSNNYQGSTETCRRLIPIPWWIRITVISIGWALIPVSRREKEAQVWSPRTRLSIMPNPKNEHLSSQMTLNAFLSLVVRLQIQMTSSSSKVST